MTHSGSSPVKPTILCLTLLPFNSLECLDVNVALLAKQGLLRITQSSGDRVSLGLFFFMLTRST